MHFCKNIGCLVSDPTFGLGNLRLCYNEESQKISINNRNSHLIRMKIDFYEVFLSYFIYCLIIFLMTVLTPFSPPDLRCLSHQGKGVQELLTKSVQVGRGKGYILMVEVKLVNRCIQ